MIMPAHETHAGRHVDRTWMWRVVGILYCTVLGQCSEQLKKAEASCQNIWWIQEI